ncbi:urate hydroxylase PuuD [Inquilinus limosus]|uniref:urate hydroxylase PuuD n=1 Tax=Inquilinus limosus TaxID=171674 RepID=UPI003F135C3E
MGIFDPTIIDLLSAILRWLHVLAAIAWMGFGLWLRRLAMRSEQLIGQPAELEVWETHSLGFWCNQKVTRPTPEQINGLVWSFVQIRWLFVTGVLLFAVIYYRQPQLYLVGPDWPMSSAEAIALSIGGLVGAPLLNELVNRLNLRNERLYDGLCVAHLIGWVAVYTSLFSAHGAMIQIGAMLGVTVVTNILGYLLPATRRAAAALKAGQLPDPVEKIRWDRRNKHTLLLPAIIFFMLSSHFGGVVANGHPFLTILLVLAASVVGRLILEETHRNHGVTPRRWVWAGSLLALGAISPLLWWPGTQADARPTAGPATDLQVGQIIGQRCAVCHAVQPSFPDMTAPPKGIVFTSDTLADYAHRINLMVASGSMPPGNATGMTDAERSALLQWTSQWGR